MLSHRSLGYLPYNLLPFPLYQVFPDSLVGRNPTSTMEAPLP